MKVNVSPTISPIFNNNSVALPPAPSAPAQVEPSPAEERARDLLQTALAARSTVSVELVTPPKPRSAVWRAALVTGLTILFTAAWHATGWSVHDVSVFLAEKGRELVALLGG